MGIGQITDMDVIANAGAIRRVVVVAEDLQVGSMATHHVEHQRDQVGFRVVLFAEISVRISAGGVEVAEDHARQPIGGSEISQ